MSEFIRIETSKNRYFCLEQNLVFLAWLLFFKKNILTPIAKIGSRDLSLYWVIRNRIQRNIRYFQKTLIVLLRFASYKYQIRKKTVDVELPFFGHMCLPVHRGYKIFDFRRCVAVKVFDSDVELIDISREIDQLKYASQFNFAPSLRRWNLDERWLEEEYIWGTLESSFRHFDADAMLEKFSKQLIPSILCFISTHQPRTVGIAEYLGKVTDPLKSSRIAGQESTENEYKTIKNFIDLCLERLCDKDDIIIFLVFTHGDFVPANMLRTKDGIKIIDWEGAACRSALFDVYSYYFFQPVYRNIPVQTLVPLFKKALSRFIEQLTMEAPPVSDSIAKHEEVYRWIFYIELICKEVERERTDKNLNIMQDVLKYIDVFTQFEEMQSGFRKLKV